MATQDWESMREKWVGMFTTALKKVQKQVHPNMDLADDALNDLDGLLYSLMAHLCAQQHELPASVAECEQCVKKLFPTESATLATWAISEAKQAVDRFQGGRRRSVAAVSATEFPVDKAHQRLMKDCSRGKPIKLDIEVAVYLMAVLDYVAADVLKLVGEYVLRIGAVQTIHKQDLQTAISGDRALDVLLNPLATLPSVRTEADLDAAPDPSHGEALKEMMHTETKHQTKLDMLVKVFLDYFESYSTIISEESTMAIFGNIKVVVEINQGLLSLLEESLNLAESRSDLRYAPIGACLLSFIEDGEMDGYKEYADNYELSKTTLQSLMDNSSIVQQFEQDNMLPAIQSILPELLLEPVLHLRYYFELIELLIRVTPSEEPDVGRLRQALSALKYVDRSVSIERIPTLAMYKSRNRMPYYLNFRNKFRLDKLQKNIGDWSGTDLSSQAEGILMNAVDIRIWHDKTKKSSFRKAWIFDTVAIFCKTADRKGCQYRLKERFDSRDTIIKKLIDTSDFKNALLLKRKTNANDDNLILVADSPAEMEEIYTALVYNRTTKLLDHILQQKVAEYERDLPNLMPDVSIYKFSELDSARNVRFESDQVGQTEVVKGGTLLKLVERLTYPKHADMNYVKHFLISFRSFCTPVSLLDLLIERYKIPLPELDDHGKTRLFVRKVSGPIKLRVVNVLKQWIEKHYSDFKNDGSILRKLLEFIKADLSTDPTMKSKVALLTKSIRKQRELSEHPLEVAKDLTNPAPPVLWPQFPSDTLHVLTLHPTEVARQLTKLESELYRAVKASELTGQGWTKSDKVERAPNVLNMIDHFNKVSNWVTRTVLEMNNLTERIECISLFLDILRELRELQNFNGIMEILSGLQISAVKRLKYSWAEVSPKRMKVMDECAALVAPEKSFTRLRRELSQLHPPCVPFFGMYLTQILHVEEGSSDYLPVNATNDASAKGVIMSELINFGKCRLVAKVILEIQQYQNEPYNLNVEPEIRVFLLDCPGLTTNLDAPSPDAPKSEQEAFQEKLYQMSLRLEPRGVEDRAGLENGTPLFADSAKGRKELMNKISKSGTDRVFGGLRGRLGSTSSMSSHRSLSGSAPSSGLARTYSVNSNPEAGGITRSNSTSSRTSSLSRSVRSTSGASAYRQSTQSPTQAQGTPPLPPRRSTTGSRPPLPQRGERTPSTLSTLSQP